MIIKRVKQPSLKRKKSTRNLLLQSHVIISPGTTYFYCLKVTYDYTSSVSRVTLRTDLLRAPSVPVPSVLSETS